MSSCRVAITLSSKIGKETPSCLQVGEELPLFLSLIKLLIHCKYMDLDWNFQINQESSLQIGQMRRTWSNVLVSGEAKFADIPFSKRRGLAGKICRRYLLWRGESMFLYIFFRFITKKCFRGGHKSIRIRILVEESLAMHEARSIAEVRR